MMTDLDRLMKEYPFIRHTLPALRNGILTLDRKIKETETIAKDSKKLAREWFDKHRRLEIDVEMLQRIVKQHEDMIPLQKEIMVEQSVTISKNNARIDELTSERDLASREVDRLRSEKHEVSATMAENESLIKALAAVIEDKNAENEEKIRLLEDQDMVIEMKDAIIVDLVEARNSLAIDFASLESDLVYYSTIIKDKDTEINDRDTLIKQREATIVNLCESQQAADIECANLEIDLFFYKTAFEERVAEIRNMDRLIEEKDTIIRNLVVDRERADVKIDRLENEIKAYRADIEEKVDEIQKKDLLIEKNEEKIEKNKSIIEEKEDLIFQLTVDRDLARESLENLKLSVDEEDYTIYCLKQEIKRLDEEERKIICEPQQDVDRVKEEIEVKDCTIDDLENGKKEQNKKDDETVEHLQENVYHLERDTQQINEKIENFHDEQARASNDYQILSERTVKKQQDADDFKRLAHQREMQLRGGQNYIRQIEHCFDEKSIELGKIKAALLDKIDEYNDQVKQSRMREAGLVARIQALENENARLEHAASLPRTLLRSPIFERRYARTLLSEVSKSHLESPSLESSSEMMDPERDVFDESDAELPDYESKSVTQRKRSSSPYDDVEEDLNEAQDVFKADQNKDQDRDSKPETANEDLCTTSPPVSQFSEPSTRSSKRSRAEYEDGNPDSKGRCDEKSFNITPKRGRLSLPSGSSPLSPHRNILVALPSASNCIEDGR